MNNSEFAHLHLHTDASIRDGMGTVSNMMRTAKALGFRQIAMTDHGTLANAITFSIEAKAQGIKPLIGLEGYIAMDGELGHITLLADGMRGWDSLLKLNNKAHKSEFKQPAFTVDELVEHNSGLVCLTGCVASPFHRLSFREAQRLGGMLKGVFGHRLFAELMFVGDGGNWERPMRLADSLGLSCVITNDVHFAHKTDAVVHPILTKMKSGFEYDSRELYLKDVGELVKMAVAYGVERDEAVRMVMRAGKIAQKLGVVELHQEPKLPSGVVRDGRIDWVGYTGTELISMACRARFRRYVLDHPLYMDRFHMELGVIESMGYADYFLILDDIIQNAKDAGVRVGPGRGSGAGSLILFMLGITDVDPIEHGLQFERFLNIERKGMPDVDVDIDSENREKVLEYASKMYGAIPIATYSRYSHKSLTRDLGKMFRIDKELINKAAEGGDTCDEFFEIVDSDIGREFFHAYQSFIGQMRHKGKHAGGVIITETPVPIERISGGLAAAWTEGKQNELSYAGIVKFDLLGLSVLSALRRLETEMEFNPSPCEEGSPVFEIFKTGNLSGIFQFSGSDGIRKLTMELQPESLADLTAINALYRPGAIDSGATGLYPAWKKTPRKVPSFIAPILEETYGAIVYQEQVMSIFQCTMGGTLAEADEVRRLITKAKPDDPTWHDKMERTRSRFVGKAIADHKLTVEQAAGLWDELATHSRYSFNKSHSTAYSMIAWECAWWKFHHPTHFYAAMLNVDKANEQTYIMDAVKSGITIGPPHVNKSNAEWSANSFENTISMPLSAIKFMGKKGVDILIETREILGGQFDNIEEFMAAVPKKFVRGRAREGLLRLGGFSGLFDITAAKTHTMEGVIKTLALKPFEAMTSKRARQLKYLGFIIPTRRMLEGFEKYGAEGYVCGIINSKDMRESKWGAYAVYRMSPEGVFWSREVKDMKKGEVVAVKISDKNGKAKEIKFI